MMLVSHGRFWCLSCTFWGVKGTAMNPASGLLAVWALSLPRVVKASTRLVEFDPRFCMRAEFRRQANRRRSDQITKLRSCRSITSNTALFPPVPNHPRYKLLCFEASSHKEVMTTQMMYLYSAACFFNMNSSFDSENGLAAAVEASISLRATPNGLRSSNKMVRA